MAVQVPEGEPPHPLTLVSERRSTRARRLHRGLVALAGVLVVLALALRIGVVDGTSYHAPAGVAAYLNLGGQVAAHGDYSSFDRGLAGSIGPTASLPPAFPYLLGATNLIDGQAPQGAAAIRIDRTIGAVIGTASVVLIALIALELAGEAVALAALALAAVYPPLVDLSGVLLPQNLFTMLVLAAGCCMLQARARSDSVPWLIGAGILTGLATLAQETGILLLIPLLFAARGTRPVLGRRQVPAPGVLMVAALLALSPWLIRSAGELHRFVPVTDRGGALLAGTYNPTSASSANGFGWRPIEDVPALSGVVRGAPRLTEPQLDSKLAGNALSYIGGHPLAPLQAAGHNALRLLGVESAQARRASAQAAGLGSGAATLSTVSFWILAALALLGVATRAAVRRRPLFGRMPLWLWGMPLVLMLAAALVDPATEVTRLPLDAFLIVPAAATLVPVLVPLVRQASTRFLNWQYASRA